MPESIVARTGFPENFLNYYRKQEFTGLFFAAPLLAAAPLGAAVGLFRGETRRLTAWLLALLIPTCVLMAKHRTVFGGSTFDTRYIFHVTPFLFLLAALGIDRVAAVLPGRVYEVLLGAAVLVFGLLPIRTNLLLVARDTHRMLKICPGLAAEGSRADLLFPNLTFLGPTLAVLLVAWLAIGLAAFAWLKNRRQDEATPTA